MRRSLVIFGLIFLAAAGVFLARGQIGEQWPAVLVGLASSAVILLVCLNPTARAFMARWRIQFSIAGAVLIAAAVIAPIGIIFANPDVETAWMVWVMVGGIGVGTMLITLPLSLGAFQAAEGLMGERAERTTNGYPVLRRAGDALIAPFNRNPAFVRIAGAPFLLSWVVFWVSLEQLTDLAAKRAEISPSSLGLALGATLVIELAAVLFVMAWLRFSVLGLYPRFGIGGPAGPTLKFVVCAWVFGSLLGMASKGASFVSTWIASIVPELDPAVVKSALDLTATLMVILIGAPYLLIFTGIATGAKVNDLISALQAFLGLGRRFSIGLVIAVAPALVADAVLAGMIDIRGLQEPWQRGLLAFWSLFALYAALAAGGAYLARGYFAANFTADRDGR